jgi:hypothetical protein
VKYLVTICFTIAVTTSINEVQGQSAATLLREGSRYQAADDTSDRAPGIYRQLIMKYPKSAEAESAQFFMGAYYSRKFFILEQRSNVQDWGSMNRAEEELSTYITRYPRGFYIADSYNTLAIIALRRGLSGPALSRWNSMKSVASKDPKVYIFRVTWSPGADDVIKGYCNTESLAYASLRALDTQSSFNGVVAALTSWAREHCR